MYSIKLLYDSSLLLSLKDDSSDMYWYDLLLILSWIVLKYDSRGFLNSTTLMLEWESINSYIVYEYVTLIEVNVLSMIWTSYSSLHT